MLMVRSDLLFLSDEDLIKSLVDYKKDKDLSNDKNVKATLPTSLRDEK